MSHSSPRLDASLNIQSLFSLLGAIVLAGWSQSLWSLDVALSLTVLLYLLLWGHTGFPIPANVTTTLKQIEGNVQAMATPVEPDGGTLDVEVKTYGAGAFSGMLLGAGLGYPFGTAGVLVGGVIGTFVGEQLEYEHRKQRLSELLGEQPSEMG